MFGIIVADSASLTDAQKARYRGCYCGLCRTLQQRHGELSRLTLNYDTTFLALFLSALYEPEETGGTGRCLPHPLHPRQWWTSRFTNYAADMTVVLAYQKCRDDWADERKILARGGAELLRRRYEDAAARWPEQRRAVESGLARLAQAERDGDGDAATNSFGALMGALFVPEPDPLWGALLARFGTALGRFIYMMDACVDLEDDRKKGCFNPLLVTPLSGEDQLTLLKLAIGEAAAAFEVLPIVRDAELLRNILYSGVWTQYAQSMRKKKGETNDDKRPV